MRALVDLLAPAVCVSCGGPAGAGLAVLCVTCRAELPRLGDPCPRCALPRPCGDRCPHRDAPWLSAWAPFVHDGPARDLVRALKFRGVLGAATVMAAQIVAAAPRGLLDGDAALVPAPADPARRRRRGLDHAALLAKAIADRTGSPVGACLLTAGKAGARQLGAGRAARQADSGVRVACRGSVPPSAVVIDDVHTTGATLAACATALRAAGTRRIVVISFTRTLP